MTCVTVWVHILEIAALLAVPVQDISGPGIRDFRFVKFWVGGLMNSGEDSHRQLSIILAWHPDYGLRLDFR
jgi:hypothetical protein